MFFRLHIQLVMKLKCLYLVTVLSISFLAPQFIKAQGIFTGINNTVINLPCNQVCTGLNFQVPHLRSDDDYQIVNIPYTPYPYTTAGGNELTALYSDDRYSQAISLPFPICFYGDVFNQVVVGSNGLLTFDIANANCDAAYTVTPPVPYALGSICQQAGIYYPASSVMAVFSDLNPQGGASPAGRKIEWRMEGATPFRRFIASWNRIGVYGNNACGVATPTTFQIVINESTSVIEVFIEQKICQDNSTGRAILGVQDRTRTRAVAAPGKNATFWTSTNEGYRFIPSGVTSRFVSAELFDINGVTLIATATTSTTNPALVDISFPNVCITPPSQQYIVRTTYASCINPAIPIVINDTITINRNPELNATASTTNTLCGIPSGSIQVAVPTGVGVSPYTFILNPGPGQVVQTGPSPMVFNGLSQGLYNVVVTDFSGNCSSTLTNINVGRTNNLTANITTVSTSCPAVNNGSITVTPTTGSGVYTFVLNPGNIIQTGNSNTTFSGLAANAYTVEITDGSGCVTNPIPVTVAQGPALLTTATHTNVLCFGAATGSITVAVPAGGTPPYQYSLDNTTWQASNVFTGLIAGTYTVYFREWNGCSGQLSLTITEPQVLSANVNAIAALCNGQNNGTITVTALGGAPPYEFSIDGGVNWQPSNIFNVPANNYIITVRDANFCTATQAITVTEPAVLSATAITTNASCNGGNDGTITITATGGNTTYQYSIDGGSSWQPSNVFNVSPANYTVDVRDNLGCTFQFATTVGLTNNLVFTPQVDATICESKSTQLELVSNATQYAWTPSVGLSSTTISNPIANPTITTTYTVTATFGRCSINDIVTVQVNPAPVPNAGSDAFICYGQTYALQGSGGVQYSWSPSTFLNGTTGANPISNPTRTITYTLSKVTDALGCESLVTDEMVLDVTPPIKVNTFPFDTVAHPGDRFQLVAIPAISTANIFTWTPASRLSNATISNPVVTIGGIGDDVVYKVTAETTAGCKGEGYVRVHVYKGPELYVPTGFTPNNDGKNDTFYPFPVGIKSINYFRVFNRWGQLLFATAKLQDGWDGKLNAVEQPAGTYVWMAEGVTNDNKIITKKGTVVLIR